MIVNVQKKIEFINDCECIVDYSLLESAILWYQDKPTSSKKHIYMFGKYAAISIHEKKLHIHRLIMQYLSKTKLPINKYVHHKNGNKLDNRVVNLQLVDAATHQSYHNKGKQVSRAVVEQLIEFNHTRKGTKQPLHRPDVSVEKVQYLLENGLSFNKIAIMLNADWSTIKARAQYMHDNPELLEVEK